jgi:polyhydroxyalkanoate synthase
MVDAHGNVPIDLMESGFSMMAPVQRITKWLEVFRRIDDPEFVTTFLAMERWASDNVPVPRRALPAVHQGLLPGEQFLRGPHGRRRPHRRPRPDLLPAPDAPRRLRRHRPAPDEHGPIEQGRLDRQDDDAFPVGHIGLSTSSKGPKQIWPKVAAWLAAHSEPLTNS